MLLTMQYIKGRAYIGDSENALKPLKSQTIGVPVVRRSINTTVINWKPLRFCLRLMSPLKMEISCIRFPLIRRCLWYYTFPEFSQIHSHYWRIWQKIYYPQFVYIKSLTNLNTHRDILTSVSGTTRRFLWM